MSWTGRLIIMYDAHMLPGQEPGDRNDKPLGAVGDAGPWGAPGIGDDDQVRTYDYLVRLATQNADGTLRSGEEMDRTLLHELRHVKQMADGALDSKVEKFDYNNDKQLKMGKIATRAAAGIISASTWAGAVAERFVMTRGFDEIIERFDFIPHAKLVATIGMGVAAVGETLLAAGVTRLVNKNMRSLFHVFNKAENEARAAEKLAKDHPVFRVARAG